MSKHALGAGVTLALVLAAAPAFAQMAPSASNQSSAPAAQTSREEAAARNRAIADQYNLPTDLLTDVEDRWGRPQPRTIEDSLRELGLEGVRMRALDDFDYCNGLIAIDALYTQIREADLAVQQAEEAVKTARTNAERRMAEARLGRARNNLVQMLGTIVRLGLASAIPGAGWAYGGYILVSEVTQWSARNQHNREVSATDALNEYFLAMGNRHDLAMRAYSLRIEQYDRRGRLWDGTMKRWCAAQRPRHERMIAATSGNAPTGH